jgi:hypothetical protein
MVAFVIVMAKKSRFEELRDKQLKETFGWEDIEDYDNFNVINYPDNRFGMIKRICPYCSAVDAKVHEWKERKYRNKENKTVIILF